MCLKQYAEQTVHKSKSKWDTFKCRDQKHQKLESCMYLKTLITTEIYAFWTMFRSNSLTKQIFKNLWKIILITPWATHGKDHVWTQVMFWFLFLFLLIFNIELHSYGEIFNRVWFTDNNFFIRFCFLSRTFLSCHFFDFQCDFPNYEILCQKI